MTTPTRDEIDHDALLARADSLPPTDGIGADCLITQMALAIRALRDQREADAKDAARYHACRHVALAANTDPMIDAMRDWPDVTTPEEFDVQSDKIVVAMAAQEKANG